MLLYAFVMTFLVGLTLGIILITYIGIKLDKNDEEYTKKKTLDWDKFNETIGTNFPTKNDVV